MINDKISIVIPVYNLENYIVKTLECVCNQTYKNLEILVVDDGSKDNSWNLICDFAKKDDRVKPIHQENGGVTSARLNAIKNATGEWIGFVDGDDLIDDDMYEILINNAYKFNAEISHCGYKMIFDDGRDTIFYNNTGELIEQDNNTACKGLLDGSIEPGLWNKLFKISLFNKIINNNLMDFSIKINEDLLMNYYLFKESKKAIFEGVSKYIYVSRQNSAHRTVSKNAIVDPIKVREIIYNDCNDELKPIIKRACIVLSLNIYSNYMNIKGVDKEAMTFVYNKIKEYGSDINILDNKNKLVMRLILTAPSIYKLMYKILK